MKNENYPAENHLHDFTHERKLSFTVWKSFKVSNSVSAGLTVKKNSVRAECSVCLIQLLDWLVLTTMAIIINPSTRHRFEPLLRGCFSGYCCFAKLYKRYHHTIKMECFISFYKTGKWVGGVSLNGLSLEVWNRNMKFFQGFIHICKLLEGGVKLPHEH